MKYAGEMAQGFREWATPSEDPGVSSHHPHYTGKLTDTWNCSLGDLMFLAAVDSYTHVHILTCALSILKTKINL